VIERDLAELLVMEIDFHVSNEQAKNDLENVPGFCIKRVFKAIDEQNSKYIGESALRRFLKKVGHRPLKHELISIMRRLDLDGDKRISYAEFCEAF
jgi:Ca2+-binding EF-hand superfamily protein